MKQKLLHLHVTLRVLVSFSIIFLLVEIAHQVTRNLQVAYILSMLILGVIFGIRNQLGILRHTNRRRSWLLIAILSLIYSIALFLADIELSLVNFGHVLASILTIMVNATWEEVVFRGVLFAHHVQKRGWYQVILVGFFSTILFTLTHVVNFQRSNQADTYIVLVFLLGVIFCQVYLLTRNILFVAVLHTTINVIHNMFVMNLGQIGAYGSTVVIGIVVLVVVVLAWLIRKWIPSLELPEANYRTGS